MRDIALNFAYILWLAQDMVRSYAKRIVGILLLAHSGEVMIYAGTYLVITSLLAIESGKLPAIPRILTKTGLIDASGQTALAQILGNPAVSGAVVIAGVALSFLSSKAAIDLSIRYENDLYQRLILAFSALPDGGGKRKIGDVPLKVASDMVNKGVRYCGRSCLAAVKLARHGTLFGLFAIVIVFLFPGPSLYLFGALIVFGLVSIPIYGFARQSSENIQQYARLSALEKIKVLDDFAGTAETAASNAPAVNIGEVLEDLGDGPEFAGGVDDAQAAAEAVVGSPSDDPAAIGEATATYLSAYRHRLLLPLVPSLIAGIAFAAGFIAFGFYLSSARPVEGAGLPVAQSLILFAVIARFCFVALGSIFTSLVSLFAFVPYEIPLIDFLLRPGRAS